MNKQEWKELAERAIDVLMNRIWDDIADSLAKGEIENDSGLNDDDWIDEKVDGILKAYLDLSGEQLDKILHGEMK